MGEHRGQANEAGILIDRGCLHGRDLVLAQRFANDVEPGRKRCIAKRAIAFPRERGPYGGDQRLFRICELGLGFGQRAAMAPIELLERCIADLRFDEVEADRT